MSYVKTNKSIIFGESSVLEEKLLYQGRWSNLVEFIYEDEKKTDTQMGRIAQKKQC